MKKILLTLLIFLLAFSITFGQKTSELNKTKTKPQSIKADVPKGWKLVDLDSFSFLLPESMENKKAQGKDSQVWRFEDNEMELVIDSGMYTNDFQDLKKSYEVKRAKAVINGKKVIFYMWDENKDISGTYAVNKDGSIKPHETYEKHFAIGVYFQKGKRRYTGTNFIITTKTLETQETAKKILYSIKFKK